MAEPTQYSQWYKWAKKAIPEKRLRPYAIRAAVEAVNGGATSEAAAEAANAAAAASRPLALEARRHWEAGSSIFLFALGLLFGPFSLILSGFGLAAGIIGVRARARIWLVVAIAGIGLNAGRILWDLLSGFGGR